MGREATPEELSERIKMPEYKARKVLKITKEPISMETAIGDDEDASMSDFIEDVISPPSLTEQQKEGRREVTKEGLACLTGHESKVLPYYPDRSQSPA